MNLNPHNVKVGQIWRSWDSRTRDLSDDTVGRFKIIEIDLKSGKAVVERLGHHYGAADRRRIALARFRECSTGYKLLEDVPVPKLFTFEDIKREIQEPSIEAHFDPPIQKKGYLQDGEDMMVFDGTMSQTLDLEKLGDDEVLIIEIKP